VRSAQAEADRVGPKLSELVQSLFASSHPLRHLRRVQGILRLLQSGRVSNPALEYAADKALLFRKLTLNYIKACAEHYDANGARLVLVKPRRADFEVFLHSEGGDSHAHGGEA
jgi:hypothetical protein